MTTIQDFDYSVDLLQVILWQYDKAVNLQGIIQNNQDWLNTYQTQFWQDWYDNVFNLDTANDFGLAVWAKILDINLGDTVAARDDIWGVTDGNDHNNLNFDNSNFQASNDTLILSTEAKRVALKLRYYQLTAYPSASQANAIMADVFQDYGTAYVVDNYDMTIEYIFNFTPDPQIAYLINNFDLLPRPAAVGIGADTSVKPILGVTDGNSHNNANFDNGNFSDG